MCIGAGVSGGRMDRDLPPDPVGVEQDSGVTAALLSVSAVDDGVVWAAGENGTVVRTTDGGATWEQASGSGLSPSMTLHNIWGHNADLASVTGSTDDAGFIYRTLDGGAVWTEVFSLEDASFTSIICRFVRCIRCPD